MIDRYDTEKNNENIRKHGISFDDVTLFQWETALTDKDARKDYKENRYVSIGYIGERLHVLVWTFRNNNVRPISLRKANKRERRSYDG